MKNTKYTIRWSSSLLVAVLAFAVASVAHATSLPVDSKLPDAVASTFKAKFPNGKIEKLDVTAEEGVNVYDIEFSDGKTEKETDIAEDGTMLEFTLVISQKEIPAAPLKAIRDNAKGAKLGRMEKIEANYITRDGKVEKLPTTTWRYAAEMTKKGQQAEVIVNADGTMSEEPKWAPIAK